MWTEWEWGEKQSQEQLWAGQFSSGSRGGVDVLSSDAGGAWGVLEVLFQKGDASWGGSQKPFLGWGGQDLGQDRVLGQHRAGGMASLGTCWW